MDAAEYAETRSAYQTKAGEHVPTCLLYGSKSEPERARQLRQQVRFNRIRRKLT